MKRLTLSFLIVAIAFHAYAAKPGGGGGGDGCSDIPIIWTFENSTTTGIPSAITGDGKRSDSRGGVDGVFNSVIHRISNRGCEGSRDATLSVFNVTAGQRLPWPVFDPFRIRITALAPLPQ